MEEMNEMPMMKEKMKPMMSEKPTIQLSAEDLPAIRTWKNGGVYDVTAKLKQVSGDGNSASFEILEIMDKDFNEKSYTDLMAEGGEENDIA